MTPRGTSRPDPLTPAQRAYNMSRIRGKDTRPEMLIRRGLHARGFRYRLHDRSLPGTPDLVFPGRRAVVFVHGCFWHGHDCGLHRTPSTRTEFWEAKIAANQARDARAMARLCEADWRVMTVWECALRGPGKRLPEAVLDRLQAWLLTPVPFTELAGGNSGEGAGGVEGA